MISLMLKIAVLIVWIVIMSEPEQRSLIWEPGRWPTVERNTSMGKRPGSQS